VRNSAENAVTRPKRKPWQIILLSAALGLAIAAVVNANSWAASDSFESANPAEMAVLLASPVVCPPSLLFAMCIDCDASGWDGFYMFSIIGGLNTALYAAFGAVIVLTRDDRQ
jgi:hypothetical protein